MHVLAHTHAHMHMHMHTHASTHIHKIHFCLQHLRYTNYIIKQLSDNIYFQPSTWNKNCEISQNS